MDARTPSLKGQKFYLDLKGYGKPYLDELTESLTLLGATVEQWFSCQVTFVVTSEGRKEDYAAKTLLNSNNNISSLLSTPETLSNPNLTPPCTNPNLSSHASRASQILLKATQAEQPKCDSMKIVDLARQFNVGIMHIDKMKHVLHKRHKTIDSLRQMAAVKRQSTCHSPAVIATSLPPDNAVVRQLRDPCIKVESVSRRFRPLYKEFDAFPAIISPSPSASASSDNAVVDDHSPPALAAAVSCSNNSSVASTQHQQRATSGSKVKVAGGVTAADRQCAKQRQKARVSATSFYCEICQMHSRDSMKKHRLSSIHQAFSNDDANFACIDKTIRDKRLDMDSLMARLRLRAAAAAADSASTSDFPVMTDSHVADPVSQPALMDTCQSAVATVDASQPVVAMTINDCQSVGGNGDDGACKSTLALNDTCQSTAITISSCLNASTLMADNVGAVNVPLHHDIGVVGGLSRHQLDLDLHEDRLLLDSGDEGDEGLVLPNMPRLCSSPFQPPSDSELDRRCSDVQVTTFTEDYVIESADGLASRSIDSCVTTGLVTRSYDSVVTGPDDDLLNGSMAGAVARSAGQDPGSNDWQMQPALEVVSIGGLVAELVSGSGVAAVALSGANGSAGTSNQADTSLASDEDADVNMSFCSNTSCSVATTDVNSSFFDVANVNVALDRMRQELKSLHANLHDGLDVDDTKCPLSPIPNNCNDSTHTSSSSSINCLCSTPTSNTKSRNNKKHDSATAKTPDRLSINGTDNKQNFVFNNCWRSTRSHTRNNTVRGCNDVWVKMEEDSVETTASPPSSPQFKRSKLSKTYSRRLPLMSPGHE